MKRIVRLTESDLVRIVKRVIKEGDRFNDWASQGIGSANYDRDMEYLRKRREEESHDEYEYEIKAVDCGDDVDEGHVGLSEYSDKIMIAYCKENPESLDYLKRKGQMLVKQRNTIPDFSDDDQDNLSKMRGYFGEE